MGDGPAAMCKDESIQHAPSLGDWENEGSEAQTYTEVSSPYSASTATPSCAPTTSHSQSVCWLSEHDASVPISPITPRRHQSNASTTSQHMLLNVSATKPPLTPRSRQASLARASWRLGSRPEATSRFKGVTLHCRTARWEAHLWQDRKQVYLGGFDTEEQAALAYDIASVRFRGRGAATNFALTNYEQELEHLHEITCEELVAALRQQSKGFVKESSPFKGVTKHAKGKWEARIGQMAGRKYKYLGLYETQVEAAMAYDVQAIANCGVGAATNFVLSTYRHLLTEEQLSEAIQQGLLFEHPELDLTSSVAEEPLIMPLESEWPLQQWPTAELPPTPASYGPQPINSPAAHGNGQSGQSSSTSTVLNVGNSPHGTDEDGGDPLDLSHVTFPSDGSWQNDSLTWDVLATCHTDSLASAAAAGKIAKHESGFEWSLSSPSKVSFKDGLPERNARKKRGPSTPLDATVETEPQSKKAHTLSNTVDGTGQASDSTASAIARVARTSTI